MLYKEDFGEGKNIEFKREIPKRHEKLLKDVIAFSNSTGGKIFIGIDHAEFYPDKESIIDVMTKIYGLKKRE